MLLRLLFTVLLLLPLTSKADDKVIHLTSLEWPPYSSAHIDGGGLNVETVRKAFDEMGYRLEITFYPWKRAVDEGLNSKKFAGYFPEYPGQDLKCDLSDVIGTSLLGFVENSEKPIEWETLTDLQKYTIGTVSGYVNTDEFDTEVKEGKLIAQPVHSDIINLRKVAKKRLDLAVVDKHVLNYLIMNDEMLKRHKHLLQFNKKILNENTLHVCFANSFLGQHTMTILNKGLVKLNN